jgi:ABC-type sugar transport system substrate-binding protein
MMNKYTARGLAVFTACCTAFLVAGCSAAGSTPAASAGSDSKGTIGVSVPTTEGPFFTSMLYGITQQAKSAGYNVSILSAGGYGKIDQQVSQIQNLISKKTEIIMVDPADPNATKPAIEQARAAGLTVIGAGDPAPGGQGYSAASHCDVGKALATGAKKLLPDGGKIGVMAGPAGAFWSTERLRCFKDGIKNTSISVVAEKATDPDVALGLSGATDMLQRFPDLNLLYGADDTVGVGAAEAVQAANRCGKTQVLTAVYGEQVQSLMAKGCVQYDVALQPVLIGREAVKLAVALHEKKKPAVTEVNVPLVAITPDTMKSVNIDNIRSPKSYKPAA